MLESEAQMGPEDSVGDGPGATVLKIALISFVGLLVGAAVLFGVVGGPWRSSHRRCSRSSAGSTCSQFWSVSVCFGHSIDRNGVAPLPRSSFATSRRRFAADGGDWSAGPRTILADCLRRGRACGQEPCAKRWSCLLKGE